MAPPLLSPATKARNPSERERGESSGGLDGGARVWGGGGRAVLIARPKYPARLAGRPMRGPRREYFARTARIRRSRRDGLGAARGVDRLMRIFGPDIRARTAAMHVMVVVSVGGTQLGKGSCSAAVLGTGFFCLPEGERVWTLEYEP